MTYYLDFRSAPVGGHAIAPRLWEGDGSVSGNLRLVSDVETRAVFAGKSLLFIIHGFNVTRDEALRSLGTLDRYINLTSPNVIVAVLWSGDSWIPIVDYPFEGTAAIATGRFLATYCDTVLAGVQSLSFASHSLGVRVLLEALVNLNRKNIQLACLMAGAINSRCLTQEYSAATALVNSIAILASDNDDVLKIAFAAGDPFSDLLHADHTPFQVALGLRGPPLPVELPVETFQITGTIRYGHGDYLPAGSTNFLWQRPAGFLKRAFAGMRQIWPDKLA